MTLEHRAKGKGFWKEKFPAAEDQMPEACHIWRTIKGVEIAYIYFRRLTLNIRKYILTCHCVKC